MTESPSIDEELIERLNAYDSSRPSVVPSARGTRTVYPLVNPDGPTAADRLESLLSDRAKLEEALRFAHHTLVEQQVTRFCREQRYGGLADLISQVVNRARSALNRSADR